MPKGSIIAPSQSQRSKPPPPPPPSQPPPPSLPSQPPQRRSKPPPQSSQPPPPPPLPSPPPPPPPSPPPPPPPPSPTASKSRKASVKKNALSSMLGLREGELEKINAALDDLGINATESITDFDTTLMITSETLKAALCQNGVDELRAGGLAIKVRKALLSSSTRMSPTINSYVKLYPFSLYRQGSARLNFRQYSIDPDSNIGMRPTNYDNIPMGKISSSRLNKNGPLYIVIAHGFYPYNYKHNLGIKHNLGNYSMYHSQLPSAKGTRQAKYLGIRQLKQGQTIRNTWYKNNENVKNVVRQGAINVIPDIILPSIMWDNVRIGALSDNGLTLLAVNPMSRGTINILNKVKEGNHIFHQRFPYYWSSELEVELKINADDKDYYKYLNSFKKATNVDPIIFPNILFATDKFAKDKTQDYERFHSSIIRLSCKPIDKSKSVISQLDLENLNDDELYKITNVFNDLNLNYEFLDDINADNILTSKDFIERITQSLRVHGIDGKRIGSIRKQIIERLKMYTIKQDIYDFKGSIEKRELTPFSNSEISYNITKGICEKKHSHPGDYFQTDLNSIYLVCNKDFEANFSKYKNKTKYKMNIGLSTCMSGMPSYLRDLMYADKEDTSNGKVKKGRHKNVYIPKSVTVKQSPHISNAVDFQKDNQQDLRKAADLESYGPRSHSADVNFNLSNTDGPFSDSKMLRPKKTRHTRLNPTKTKPTRRKPTKTKPTRPKFTKTKPTRPKLTKTKATRHRQPRSVNI